MQCPCNCQVQGECYATMLCVPRRARKRPRPASSSSAWWRGAWWHGGIAWGHDQKGRSVHRCSRQTREAPGNRRSLPLRKEGRRGHRPLPPEKGHSQCRGVPQSPLPGCRNGRYSCLWCRWIGSSCVCTARCGHCAVGGTVEFPEHRRLLHNLHSSSTGIHASTGRNREDGQSPLCSRHTEIIRVDCDLHPWMRAWVGGRRASLHAVTNDQGSSFSITFPRANIPFSSGEKPRQP